MPDVASVLGEGWERAYEGPLGEFWLRLYLRNGLEASRVLTATEGWGGDAGVVYVNEATGEVVAAVRTVWDTTDDADEFLRGCLAYGEARFGRSPDERYRGWDCWMGDAGLCVTWQQGYVSLIRGPSLDLVKEVADLLLEE